MVNSEKNDASVLNDDPISQINLDSYQIIIQTLNQWGITVYAGVTGGGVVHLLKYLSPYDETVKDKPSIITIGEYSAGFIPLGYYLQSGRIAAAVATTGAATKLICCGLSDCKLHDIPAVYIVPVSGKETIGLSPLQDTSEYGSNILVQLRAELPDSVFVLDCKLNLKEQLSLAKNQLGRFKPVVLVLDNYELNICDIDSARYIDSSVLQTTSGDHLNTFLRCFRQKIEGKRLVVFVGEEMARYQKSKELTTCFCYRMHAGAIWSINGANAIHRKNPYGYGYISFGGNDEAVSLYNSLGENDVLLILGACPDEYTINFKKISASVTFCASNIPQAYGFINDSLEHAVEGEYYQINAPLDLLLQELMDDEGRNPFLNVPMNCAPDNLNWNPFPPAGKDYVDMARLYQRLDLWWPAGSVGFDDVCLAYKDRQYITQRPNNNIHFYSLYRGSAMGGAFGAAIGAKLANLDNRVFLFTGDGCFRLFSGSLSEVADLGLVVFLLKNERLGIVEQGLKKIIPDFDTANYHAEVKSIEYGQIARANGWDAVQLNPNLSNLGELLKKIEGKIPRSLLIEIPVDPDQLLRNNPRLKNL